VIVEICETVSLLACKGMRNLSFRPREEYSSRKVEYFELGNVKYWEDGTNYTRNFVVYTLNQIFLGVKSVYASCMEYLTHTGGWI
jgi:hypothetical protein